MEGQDSWEQRQIIETVRLHGLALASSITQFDQIARTKLSIVESKIAKLERKVEYYGTANNSNTNTGGGSRVGREG